MDEQELNKILQGMKVPDVDNTKINQAVNAATAAFDEKKAKTAQGFSVSRRLTDIATFTTYVRRTIMEKRYIASGLAGGVAVCALVAVLGTPFIQQQMQAIHPESISYSTSGSGGLLSATQPQTTDSKDKADSVVDMTYQSALQEQDRQRIEEAARTGQSALPTPMKEEELHRAVRSEPKKSKDEAVAGKIAAPASAPVMNMMAAEGVARGGISADSMIAPYPYPMPPIDDIQPQYREDGRDKFESVKENAFKDVKAEPVSTFSIDVDTASYSFVRRSINQGQLPPADAVRVEEMINYFDYEYKLPASRQEPFAPTVVVYDSPWNAHKKIMHIGIKGYEIETKPQSNLVFLIDTSGSMNSPDKLPLLKAAFKLMLDNLNPDDTVGIVVYAGSAGTVLEPTKASDKAKIAAALDNLQAGGSTAGEAGIRQAYALAEQNLLKEGNNRIILATDGDFNVGTSNPEELENLVAQKRGQGIALSVLGFGQGNYNDHIMQSLAQNGNGNAAYIDNLNEARKVLVEEANSTLFTIAEDVKIQVEFNPAQVSEYRLVGYETRHLNREDFNNDKIDAGEVGAGATVTAIYEITPTGAPKMVDDLRYGAKEEALQKPSEDTGSSEYAFLKIRHKKPDSDVSALMTRPITPADEVKFDQASDDVRFAAAVAGFAQLLKGGHHTGSLTFDQVIEKAESARGRDAFGYRAEFINLVRLAKELK